MTELRSNLEGKVTEVKMILWDVVISRLYEEAYGTNSRAALWERVCSNPKDTKIKVLPRVKLDLF